MIPMSPILVIAAVQIISALLDRLVFDMAMSTRVMGALQTILVG